MVSTAVADLSAAGGRWVAAAEGGFVGLGWWLMACVVFFFFFLVLWGVGSVVRGGHGWWSPAWEASLASLMAWG